MIYLAAKLVGAGLATISLGGAGVGIGNNFQVYYLLFQAILNNKSSYSSMPF